VDVIASRAHYAAHLAPVAALVEDVPGVLVASYADLCTARLAHDRIVLMQHGAGQSYGDDHAAYPGGSDNDAVGLFLTPGDQPAARWRSRYPGARVEAVGTPRLDSLPRRKPGGRTVAITFHWDAGHHPEARSAFDWYVGALAGLRDQFDLIGTAHPRARRPIRAYAKLGIEYVPDFEDVCRRADLLVGDNTSALFEFAATGRPVVVMNAPWYRGDVDFGLRFWDAAGVGLQVDHPTGLVNVGRKTMDQALWPARARQREEALSKVYAYRTGAAQRAADVIRDWAA
jgi:hypothetical protein